MLLDKLKRWNGSSAEKNKEKESEKSEMEFIAIYYKFLYMVHYFIIVLSARERLWFQACYIFPSTMPYFFRNGFKFWSDTHARRQLIYGIAIGQKLIVRKVFVLQF